MPWKDMTTRDRSMTLAAWLQASATVGLLVIGLIGIWQVTPIITYQIQQQQQAGAERAAATPAADSATGRFVADAHAWWSAQVASYRRIIDLTDAANAQRLQVGYQLVAGGGAEIAPGLRPDQLIVTAVGATGEKEVVSIPVNENAMSPSQYLQCRVNQGFFSAMDPGQRMRIETAVARYLHEYMVPKAAPAFVRPGMSLRQLHDEVSLQQNQRERALAQIRALKGVLDESLSAPQ
jgi:hypothetical protein